MIRINNRWVIDVDTLGNYTPMTDQHRVDKRGDHVYYAKYGYYSSLRKALQAIADEEAKEVLIPGEISLQEAVGALRTIMDKWTAELKRIREEIGE